MTEKLFGAALLGCLTVLGILVAQLGPVALSAYLLVVLTLLVLGVRRQRALRAQRAGRTCTCCTSTVHDPIEVR